jgi:pyruvate dehydrogenase E1 component
VTTTRGNGIDGSRLRILRELERKILWLSTWTIHNANHVRPNDDGIKVGGHQASSASLVTMMTALYFDALRPQDRVAVKPHASPVFHAIQYLYGRQSQRGLEDFRAFGGAQSYPSRTKDADDVDFSTGSVGLGAALTIFASIAQDYVEAHASEADPPEEPLEQGRMVALVGDAELDEGNVFEALLEGWKHHLRNVWWVIDYNRQSLDSVISDGLSTRFDIMFESLGWRVVTLKYGRRLEAAFAGPDGDVLRRWIDDCPNDVYSALVYKGGGAWRERLQRDIGEHRGIAGLLAEHDDDALADLMTNLGGHDMEAAVQAFREASQSDQPTCFIAYTIKGYGLPFAGHKDNHAGLLTKEQMDEFRAAQDVPEGMEWDRVAGINMELAELEEFVASAPFGADTKRRHSAPHVEVPATLDVRVSREMSTQGGFGRILNELGRSNPEVARHLVTTSPDVAVSTNLGGWVNRFGVFDRAKHRDVFHQEDVHSALSWEKAPAGRHIELGIAENNLFLNLAALGLADSLFGHRLLPIGTVYDPFICRGLDALNYACYQDARFILVATPSGISLAPEGGAHQSIHTPLIGTGQPGLTTFEPAFVDELDAIVGWALEHIQDDQGGSVYLRLSTRPLEQLERAFTPELREGVLAGAYWHAEPQPDTELCLVCVGAITPEALEAHRIICTDLPGAGLLAITSYDRLHASWLEAQRSRQSDRPDADSEIERLLGGLREDAVLVTVLDGHPATLSWLGAVHGHRVVPLGVEHFGQSGGAPDLFREYRIDSEAIVGAVAQALLENNTPDALPHEAVQDAWGGGQHSSLVAATAAKRDVHHFYLRVSIEIDRLLALQVELAERFQGLPVTVNDLIVRAAALALEDVPTANVVWCDDALSRFERAGIAIAVDTPDGLVTPVVEDVVGKDLDVLSAEIRDLTDRAYHGQLAPHECQGGVITISNLGMYGVETLYPALNPPHAIILGIGAAEKRAVARGEGIAIRTVFDCTVCADHRTVDGTDAAEFLAALKGHLQEPLALSL